MKVGAGTNVLIIGHGITVEREFTLSSWATITPEAPVIQPLFDGMTLREVYNILNVLKMEELADFSIRINETKGGLELATKAWNAQWICYLLTLACKTPVFDIYSLDETRDPVFMPSSVGLMVRKRPEIIAAPQDSLDWARDHFDIFYSLLDDNRFLSAMIAYGNSHYLFDPAAKVMLLWAGIEGLFGVDAELRYRIALYAAILYDGTPEEKALYFSKIKKSYDLRSRIVHGTGMKRADLKPVFALASEILCGLLRKVVSLGRVPELRELDSLAACVSIDK